MEAKVRLGGGLETGEEGLDSEAVGGAEGTGGGADSTSGADEVSVVPGQGCAGRQSSLSALAFCSFFVLRSSGWRV